MKRIFILIVVFLAYQLAWASLINIGLAWISQHVMPISQESMATYTLILATFLYQISMIVHLHLAGYFRFSLQSFGKLTVGQTLVTIPLAICAIVFFDLSAEFLNLPNLLVEQFLKMSQNVLGFICIAFLAPLLEEMLFRGAIEGYMLRKGQKPIVAILVSALIFGIIHINPAQVAFAFGLGLVLGWLYYRSGSILPCIIAHCINNTISATIMCMGNADLVNKTTSEIIGIYPAIILAVCTLSGGLYCAWFLWKKWKFPQPRFVSIVLVIVMGLMACPSHGMAQTAPVDSLRIYGQKYHVQGIAYDKQENCFYCSFTTSFYKVDSCGQIIASIDHIHGHLGAMTFDEKARKIYASLEQKDDAIGRGISNGMGLQTYSHNDCHFYIAEIDVDNMTMTTHELPQVRADYLSGHYGCAGIDGVTIAPKFGKPNSKARLLYVAYGIYGDTTRTDNDHNILLCYKLGHFKKPIRTYFIPTGNTTYGVQNLAYDAFTQKMYMAVYPGQKKQFPNYKLFAVDMTQRPVAKKLTNIPYAPNKVWVASQFTGSHFRLGSTGLCPTGDGFYYISTNGKENGKQFCDIKRYQQTGHSDNPFERVP